MSSAFQLKKYLCLRFIDEHKCLMTWLLIFATGILSNRGSKNLKR